MENEVEERKAFLDKMYQLGKGKEYHTMIETQISQVDIYAINTVVTVVARMQLDHYTMVSKSCVLSRNIAYLPHVQADSVFCLMYLLASTPYKVRSTCLYV